MKSMQNINFLPKPTGTKKEIIWWLDKYTIYKTDSWRILDYDKSRLYRIAMDYYNKWWNKYDINNKAEEFKLKDVYSVIDTCIGLSNDNAKFYIDKEKAIRILKGLKRLVLKYKKTKK